MPPETGGTVRPLSRDEQKRLLLLVCAADRLEWQLQARRFERPPLRRLRWLGPAARLGLAFLPRRRRRGAGQGWRRAWFWLQTGLNLFA